MPISELEHALHDLERLTSVVESSSSHEAASLNLELQDSILRVQRLLDFPKSNVPEKTSDTPAVSETPVFLPLVSAGPLKFCCTNGMVSATAPPIEHDDDSTSGSCHDEEEPWLLEGPCQLGLGEQYQSSLSNLAASMGTIDPSTEGWRMLSKLIRSEAELCQEVLQTLDQRVKLLEEQKPITSQYASLLGELAASTRAVKSSAFASKLKIAIDEELSLLSGVCGQ